MVKNNKKQKHDLDEKEIEALKQIKEYKLICESNIVSILWKQPELYFMYDNITLKSFMHNEWKVYWQIGYDIVVKENKPNLDEITVNLYLEKHPKLKEKYIEYDGYNSIELATKYIKVDNIDGYIEELNKWNVVIQLVKNRFPIAKHIKKFIDMTSEDIYVQYEAILNHIFINIDNMSGTRTYDISQNLDSLIEEMNNGVDVGLEYNDMPMLNSETNGLMLGEMYLLLAPSGTGKSSFVRSLILPSILKYDEKIIIMINEEDVRKQQKEMLVWVANNIYKKDVQKYKLNKGNFSDEFKDILIKSAKWIEQHKKQIIIVAIDSFTTDKAIKIIKKYSALGVKYFVLDTFKHDSSMNAKDGGWLDLQLNSVKLYDTIKPSGKNVCLVCTMQLTKQSTKQRCYTMENISGAKNVVDVATGCYMFRWVLPDEYDGEKNEIKVFKLSGKSGKSKVPIKLDNNKRYQVVFLTKNRFGATNEYCIVIEVDLSRNIYKEVGLCVINPDW